ncbi:Carboxynorspermidine decarboxylase [hydrothermal vent metagenome]|uniref:Carboxynorspermidine decarboxylase n=1 Tax=hydrothermal vent metagenome TaxID=652676 RepID=A0A3B1CEU0_9ZZZZ
MTIDPARIPSPAYVCEEEKLRANLKLLADAQDEAGCDIVLALKGFAMWSVFPIVREYLRGVSASSVNEARLGHEEFGGQMHYYAPAIKENEIAEVVRLSDHITFNSFAQLRLYRAKVMASNEKIGIGLRVNPECNVVETEIYNPCVRHSRLGITAKEFYKGSIDGVTGLHFHALCENSADDLEIALGAVEDKFGSVIGRMEWINFGGGHHITRPGYNVDKLVRLVRSFKKKYGVKIILEPGEAVALNAGALVATVVDIVRNEIEIAILDTSAAAHMPDALEMPYRPQIEGSAGPNVHPHTYRLAGGTCMAGDVIGDYSFPEPLAIGARLVFCDMLHYTMVKNNAFNGVPLPSIGIYRADGTYHQVREFGYDDYKNRLS